MADDCIEQIGSVRESGPYCVAGWSSGGVPAHEIVIRLRAQGQEMRLVLMDAYPAAPMDGPVRQADDTELVECARAALAWKAISEWLRQEKCNPSDCEREGPDDVARHACVSRVSRVPTGPLQTLFNCGGNQLNAFR